MIKTKKKKNDIEFVNVSLYMSLPKIKTLPESFYHLLERWVLYFNK